MSMYMDDVYDVDDVDASSYDDAYGVYDADEANDTNVMFKKRTLMIYGAGALSLYGLFRVNNFFLNKFCPHQMMTDCMNVSQSCVDILDICTDNIANCYSILDDMLNKGCIGMCCCCEWGRRQCARCCNTIADIPSVRKRIDRYKACTESLSEGYTRRKQGCQRGCKNRVIQCCVCMDCMEKGDYAVDANDNTGGDVNANDNTGGDVNANAPPNPGMEGMEMERG